MVAANNATEKMIRPSVRSATIFGKYAEAMEIDSYERYIPNRTPRPYVSGFPSNPHDSARFHRSPLADIAPGWDVYFKQSLIFLC